MMKQKLFIKKILVQVYVKYLSRILYCINPKINANISYRHFFKKNIDWKNPKNLIEKTYWLQFNSDTSLWTKYADKYLVREYVKECGYEENLPKLYGKWDNSNDIDFDNLPNSFVLKTNNGCGTNFIVKDKSEINIKSTVKKLNQWLSIPYGYAAAQIHYLRIKPCVIAEELLVQNEDDNLISPNSLIDYKIWCFNGVPECVLVVFDRKGSDYLKSLYDLEWNNITKGNFDPNYTHCSYLDIPEPKSLGKMIEIAKVLSKDIPQVRVDFYDIDGKPYFGEMTMATGFGYFSKEYYEYLGSKIDLSKVAKVLK